MTSSDQANTDLVVVFASSTVNESEEYCVILTSAEPGLSEVRLYEETIAHANHHHGGQFPADLPSIVAAVGDAVREPTSTEPSYNNSVVFVKESTTNRWGHPLRVPVQKISGTTSGYVTTYFFASGDEDDESGGDE